MLPANPLRGESDLVAGEVTYRLCYDANAFCYAETSLGKSTDAIIEHVSDEFESWGKESIKSGKTPKVNLHLTRALVWSGLQKHHPGMTISEAGEVISDAGLSASVGSVLNAFFASFGAAEEGDRQNPPKPKRPRGTG